MIFGFLERGLAVLMEVGQTLVTSIRQDSNVLGEGKVVILEQLEVMFAALAKGSRHNFSGFLVGNQLRFLPL